jgi:hypothetical protein
MNPIIYQPYKLVNMTANTVKVYDANNNKLLLVLPPSGQVTHVTYKQELVDTLDGIPVYNSVYNTVDNLPDEEANTKFIVTSQVRMTFPNRRDFYSPGELVYNSQEESFGYRGLEGQP